MTRPRRKPGTLTKDPRTGTYVPRLRVYIGFRIYDRTIKRARAVRGCTIRAEGWDPYVLRDYIVLALTGGKRQALPPEPPKGTDT